VVFSESGVKNQSIIPSTHMSRTIELVLDLNRYFRNASYVLNYTSTFLILLRGEYNSSNTRRLFTSGFVYAFCAQPADVLFIETVLLMSEAV
jgi:hypothetical protein